MKVLRSTLSLFLTATLPALTCASTTTNSCSVLARAAIPSCAQTCLADAAATVGCAAQDLTCQCDKEAAVYAAMESCVASACQEAEFQSVIDGVSSVCACAQPALAAFAVASSIGTATATVGTVAPTTATATATPTATSTSTAAASGLQAPGRLELVGGIVAAMGVTAFLGGRA
ncbi:hypothetical protein F5Y15DRAFT_411603 [Xylariaceae sp. FL0016]|nr:hypothetical protein F5Y15DRAFT_411603 [Xylariaceae sp. FL0016]